MDKVTVNHLAEMKREGQRITALAAYDFPIASVIDAAGVDLVLVGDSLGMTFRGEENTLTVTVEDIAYHTRAVRRGVKRALLVADMPFLSYHVSVEKTLENAGKMITSGAEAVKLEGIDGVVEITPRLLAAGVPVMGHLGLTPQSIHKLGGYKVQGRQGKAAQKLFDDARRLEEAGAFALVLECVPAELAARISAALAIPTVGIGAGPDCDGQILVANDMLGLTPGRTPRFVKRYADLAGAAKAAVETYVRETRGGAFPAAEHSYPAEPRRLKAV